MTVPAFVSEKYLERKDYKGAIATFKAFVAANPDHPRAAESLLAIANCQIELKDTKSASSETSFP